MRKKLGKEGSRLGAKAPRLEPPELKKLLLIFKKNSRKNNGNVLMRDLTSPNVMAKQSSNLGEATSSAKAGRAGATSSAKACPWARSPPRGPWASTSMLRRWTYFKSYRFDFGFNRSVHRASTFVTRDWLSLAAPSVGRRRIREGNGVGRGLRALI